MTAAAPVVAGSLRAVVFRSAGHGPFASRDRAKRRRPTRATAFHHLLDRKDRPSTAKITGMTVEEPPWRTAPRADHAAAGAAVAVFVSPFALSSAATLGNLSGSGNQRASASSGSASSMSAAFLSPAQTFAFASPATSATAARTCRLLTLPAQTRRPGSGSSRSADRG